MHLFSRFLRTLLAVTMGLVALPVTVGPASAQTYNYGGPGVANISVANGNVIIIRGDSGAQIPAQINAPLVPGDYVATGSGSDAEVQFDGVTMLRLANNTQVRFANLAPNSRDVQLAAGTVDLAELQTGGNAQVDTPVLSVRPNQTGDYRVSVLGNGETLVTVRSGSATVSTANGSQNLTPGSTLVDNGNSISLQNAVGFDSFDQFNISRDQSMNTAYNSNPYISPQLAGYANLANYGQWQNVPGYGYAWAPNNQTNFTPYQNGQWVWEPGYGYTWVDNAPYGYATSHYGTWFNNPNYGGWLWQPPAYQYQNSSVSLAQAFLPAVVSFFLSGGNGGSFDLSSLLGALGTGLFGGSSNADIGWIPLAPGEQYTPWYGQNYTYPMTNFMTVPSVTNIYNYYSNARVGMSMIPVSAWQSGNFTRVTVVRPQQVRRIVLVRGAVPVAPTTANLHFSTTRTVSRRIVLARAFSAPRLAAKAPPITRISFTAQRTKIESIVRTKPKIAALPPRHTAVTHPLYHAVKRAPVHVTVIKPVSSHHAAPATKAAPVHHTAPAHHAAPAAKPVTTHRETPAAPVAHPAPMAKPVARPAAHVKPVTHPAPQTKPVAPAAQPNGHANAKPHEAHAKPTKTPHPVY